MKVVHVYFDSADSHPIIKSYINSADSSLSLSVLDTSGAKNKGKINRAKYLVKTLLKSYKNKQVDWYQCHDILSFIIVLCLKGNSKIIFDAHEIYSGYISSNKFITKAFFLFEKFLHALSTKSIFPNISRAKLFFPEKTVMARKRVFIIENLLDDKLVTGEVNRSNKQSLIRRDDHCYRFLCAGTFTKVRAIEEIVKSCDKLIKDDINIQLDFVGTVNKLALELSEKFSFVSLKGRVGRKVLLDTFDRYDLSFALYKPTNLNNKYCAPTKLFENEYFGLPTLINKSDYIQDLLNREVVANCIVADSCEEQHIYEAIKRYIAEDLGWHPINRGALLWSSQKDLITSIYD